MSIVLKSGSLNLLEPSEPVQAFAGIALFPETKRTEKRTDRQIRNNLMFFDKALRKQNLSVGYCLITLMSAIRLQRPPVCRVHGYMNPLCLGKAFTAFSSCLRLCIFNAVCPTDLPTKILYIFHLLSHVCYISKAYYSHQMSPPLRI